MDLVIQNLPAKVWENLNRKAKASGRSVEAEAAAILSASLKHEPAEMDDLQEMVFEMYKGELPENEVDGLIADRRLEAKAEASKLG